MDSQRRHCETFIDYAHLDADVEDVVHDLEEWKNKQKVHPFRFELLKPQVTIRPPHRFVADIQQMGSTPLGVDKSPKPRPNHQRQDCLLRGLTLFRHNSLFS